MKKTTFIFWVVLIVLITAELSCRNMENDWPGTIETKNNIVTVTNPDQPLYSSEKLSIEEELVIGTEHIGKEFTFQDIKDLAVDDDGNIYCADSKAGHVLVLDKEGNHFNTIGKQGRGPREILRPWAVEIVPAKKVLIHDLGQFSIHYFTLDGNYLGKISTTGMVNFAYPKVDSKGDIIAGYVIFQEETRTYVTKFDPELKPVFTISSLPVLSQPPSSFDIIELLYGTNMIWNITRDDNILWGSFNEYVIHLYNPEGGLIRKIIKEHHPRKMTAEDKQKLREEGLSGPPMPSNVTIKFPDYFPPFIYFCSDEEGRIFVQTSQKTDDGRWDYYDVFDPEGKYLLRTALKSRPLVWKNRSFYTIEEDNDGFQCVKKYRVKWGT